MVAWFDPTAHWEGDYRLHLEFDFDTHSLCGIRIGSPVERLTRLGRAEDWRAARQGLFCYYSKGLEIETDAGVVTAYALIFNPAPWISSRHQTFRGVCKFNSESVILNEGTREEKIVQVFGPPHARDVDDEEILLFYDRDSVKWEVEFSLQKQLRAFIIHSPLTSVAEHRRRYG
jgi:hypothetical protein